MRRSKTGRRAGKIILIVLASVMVLAAAGIIMSYASPFRRMFTMTSDKCISDIRAVVLADLHDRRFGKENQTLVKEVKKAQPDVIFLVGDFLNKTSDDASVPLELIPQLAKIAPVYYAYGNHEYGYLHALYQLAGNAKADISEKDLRKRFDVLKPVLEEAGAIVLEENYIDTELNGTPVRIGGLYDYAFMYIHGASDEPNFMDDFCDTDRLKILMSHRPDGFVFGGGADYWDIDLVVSGHYHGGHVILPFIGGLYGGDQGYFPKYVHGMFEMGKIHLFVTSGLGNKSELLPRFNNPPEIAVIEIKADKDRSTAR